MLKATGDEVNEAHFEKLAAKALEDVFQQLGWLDRQLSSCLMLFFFFRCFFLSKKNMGIHGGALKRLVFAMFIVCYPDHPLTSKE